MPRMEFIVVDFPAPFCPIKPIMLPFGTLKLTLSSVNPSKRLVSPLISIAFSIILLPFKSREHSQARSQLCNVRGLPHGTVALRGGVLG